MNRTSRRSAAEEAEALLEAGREQPALRYDVELGLARHHHWLRSEAPMPEWASATAGTAAKSLVPVVTKTIVSAMLMGALGVAAWQVRGRLQPSAAELEQSPAAAERTQAAAPSVRDVTASDAWTAPKPIPVPDQGMPSAQPARRTVRGDVPDKRTTRFQRAHRELASARLASAPAVQRSEPADATAARMEPAAPPITGPSESEGVSAERATRREVAAAPERKPISAVHTPRPEPGPQTQAPDDLAEMQQVATAEQLLERSPSRALALVRQGDQRFARGYFQQERAYIAIMALIRLGRIDEARARAATFDKQFPALPYAARIRSALEGREAAAPP